MSLWAAVKSATAILAAATEPGPPISEYRLDMSLNTPIFPVTCACAVPHASAALTAARPNRRFIAFLLAFLPETGVHSQFSPETGAGLQVSRRPARVCGSRRGPAFCSHSQIVVQLFHVGVQFRIDEAFDDPPMFHDEIAIGD